MDSLLYVSMHTGLVHGTVCLFMPQLLLVLISPTHGGTARLSSLVYTEPHHSRRTAVLPIIFPSLWTENSACARAYAIFRPYADGQ